MTGNKKFEVDEKLGLVELTKLVETVSEGASETENYLLTKLEESTQGNLVFKDDMENSIYKRLVACIKDLKKSAPKK